MHHRRALAIVHLVALIALCMLPMQMRAGTEYPHPHALYQLLLDARDGVIDHHGLVDADNGVRHAHAHIGVAGLHSYANSPDLPTYGDQIEVSSSLAVFALLAALLTIPPACTATVWPQPRAWQGRIPALEPPPPRLLAT